MEEVSNVPLTIEGSCPEWIEGTFVRNGPVSIELNGKKMNHWFDGLAMLHSFTFENGKLSYSNKFLRSDAYNTVFHEKSFLFFGFDCLPKHPIFEKLKELLNFKKQRPLQNANVNLIKIADQYSALTEVPLPLRFDLTTADTLGALDFQDNLPKANVFESAHPLFDRRTGEKYNYMVDFGFRTHYIIYRYHPRKPFRETIAKIPVRKPSYMHSFAMTEHYFILVEFPFVVNPLNLFMMTKPFIQNYEWKPSLGTRFIVVDRKTGEVVNRIKDPNPFFAFHHINAYEENNEIILDIVTYPNADIISNISEHGYLSNKIGKNAEVLSNTQLMRFYLSSKLQSLKYKCLFAGPFELPRINENYSGYAHRYMYGSDQRLLENASELRYLYKIDAHTQTQLSWQAPGLLPGEPVFIPRPGALDEDDGMVVTIALDNQKRQAFLLMLDARTFKEIGRAYTPHAIPVGLHGQFF